MPELPEVETVMRGIEPYVRGAIIANAETYIDKLRRPIDPGFAQKLVGASVQDIRRRAKYILIDTDRDLSLLIHLGMSGKITIHEHDTPPDRIKHDHIRWKFRLGDQSAWITFNDARRFGVCDLVDTKVMPNHPMLKSLGPEPLSDAFDESVLDAAFNGKKAPIKAALLDQTIVAGLGNIYVCEALWRAGISPKRLANSVKGARAKRLTPHIKAVLQEAIASGGSTLRDYVRSDGSLGYFQHNFDVYDQEGEACHREGCTGTIKRITQSGRSTYFCGICQR